MNPIATQNSESRPAPECRLADDVVLIHIEDGSARLLDLGGLVFALDPVAAMMLQTAIDSGVEAAVQRVSEHFSADPAQVAADLNTLLRQLQDQGLLRRGAALRVFRHIRLGIAMILAILASPLTRGRGAGLRTRAWFLLLFAKLSCAISGWSATVAAWRKLRAGTRASDQSEVDWILVLERAIRSAGAHHFIRVECKERALASWVLAHDAGIAAVLVVGISPFPFAGHCWCEAGTQLISDDASRITEFRPVVRYA